LFYLREYNQKIIWVFWGQKAKKIGEDCQINKDFSLISAHPSPYSAEHGFFGSRPFSKANKMLLKIKKEPIN
jgi:uracil-DNA glycosylase